MRKKLLKVFGALLALLGLTALGFVLLTEHRFRKTYDTPLPDVTRATSPEALARGEKIFRSRCIICHTNDDGRARGKHLPEYPDAFGWFHSANLTSDPVGGVGAWSDQELARMIRTTVGRDGKLRPMGPFADMGDDDVAAVIGFLRSNDPLFTPVAEPAPKSRTSFLGRATFVWMFNIPADARPSIPVPPKGPTVEYGRYMAHAIFGCVGCHTEGFDPDDVKEKSPGAFAGGFEFNDPEGHTYYSPNITFSDAGIGRYTEADFRRAVRDGIAADGTALRFPMPQYRFADDEELDAIYTYIKGMPKSDRQNRLGTLGARKKPAQETPPEQLFTQLGCMICHGPQGIYRDKIKQSIGKPVAETARWIRNPEAVKPGTQMPTFASLIDEPTSVALARWVQEYAAARK